MRDDLVELVCVGLFAAVISLRLLWMFGEAVLRGVFSFRLGEIRDKPARVIGAIGLLGMVSFAYLAVGIARNTQPPLWQVSGFLLALAVLMVLVLSIWGVWRMVWRIVFR